MKSAVLFSSKTNRPPVRDACGMYTIRSWDGLLANANANAGIKRIRRRID